MTATARELEYAAAVKQHGSQRKAAQALGVSKSTIGKALERMVGRAAPPPQAG